MPLPNADRAVVDKAKVRGYLLSPAHPVGRFKARFFVSLGYTAEEWRRLRDDIVELGELARSLWRPTARTDGSSRSMVFWAGHLEGPLW
jgi:hypothetical protein